MRMCPNVRGFCLSNEWAGSAFAGIGAVMFVATLWAFVEFHVLITTWISQNLLWHGLLFGAATMADILLIFGFLCMGFSECADNEQSARQGYRAHKRALFPGDLHWLESLGKNPRRHRRSS